jgi:hypothetical protein
MWFQGGHFNVVQQSRLRLGARLIVRNPKVWNSGAKMLSRFPPIGGWSALSRHQSAAERINWLGCPHQPFLPGTKSSDNHREALRTQVISSQGAEGGLQHFLTFADTRRT